MDDFIQIRIKTVGFYGIKWSKERAHYISAIVTSFIVVLINERNLSTFVFLLPFFFEML